MDLLERRTIERAKKYIVALTHYIYALPVSFAGVYCPEWNYKYGVYLINLLHHQMEHDREFVAAERTLGFVDHHHPKIINAFQHKTYEIYSQRTNQMKAHAIIIDCIRRINSFTVSFERAPTHKTIDERCILLMRQLLDIVSTHPQLTLAAKILRLPEGKSMAIYWALNTQYQIIAREAQAAKDKIMSFPQVPPAGRFGLFTPADIRLYCARSQSEVFDLPFSTQFAV